jgi:branched-chain amino acid transport system substrate-binding protein
MQKGRNEMITRRIFLLSATAAAAAIELSGPVRAADTIKIGMVVTQSGAGAAAGQFVINDAKMAIDEINKAGGVLGRNLELVTEDDQGTNPGAVSAFNRLANRGDIVAYYGPTRSTQILAIEPDIRRVGKIVLQQGQDPKLTKLGNPWIFRVTVANDMVSGVVAQAGVKEMGKSKWAIVFSTDTFGKSGSDNYIAALKKLGIEPVLVQSFAAQQNDLTPVVLAVQQSGADIVATAVALETDVALLLRQAKDLGVEAPVIGGTSVVSPVTIKLAGNAANGAYGVVDFAAGSSKQAQDFYDHYVAAFGQPPAAGNSYDAMKILAKVISDAGTTETEAMRKTLLSLKDYQGVEGVYDFDKNGDGLHGLNLVKVDDGKLEFVKSVKATQ